MATKSDRTELNSLRVRLRNVQGLSPYRNNPRTHTEAQVEQLAASIAEFGFLVPILVHGDEVVAGHARLAAARRLELEKVPTVDVSFLTEAQRKAYVIADNQLATNAGWDEGLLRLELGDLMLEDFDLDLLGFNEAELAGLLGDPAEAGEEWQQMPEFEQDEQTGWKSIVVHFDKKADYEAFQKLVGQTLTEKTRSIWYPVQVEVSRNDRRYEGSA